MSKKILAVLLLLVMLASCALAESYEGVGTGKNGDVHVTVTIEDGVIKDVAVGEHSETAGIADPALERIPAAIVENQSIAVDAVAGATLTSEAIKAAVAEAIAAAGLDVED